MILIKMVLYYRPMFRSYKPIDETLKESALPSAKPQDGMILMLCLFQNMIFKKSALSFKPNDLTCILLKKYIYYKN